VPRKIYGEQRGASGKTEHNKFFQLEDNGNEVIASWGAIGVKNPRTETLVVSSDESVRSQVFEKKFKAKFGRKSNPYVVIENNGSKVEARPSNEGRGWGFEIETHSRLSPQLIGQKMQERGLNVNIESNRYFHSSGAFWDVKRDGSCGYEFASPICHGESGIFDCKIVVEKIREVCETAVNNSCGIHVTIDVSDHSPEELKRLIIGYLKAQDNFYARCNESRQNNRYCKKNPWRGISEMLNMTDPKKIAALAGGWARHEDRYHGLNMTRLFSKGLIEFRMLESSVSIRKVGAWIRLCVAFVDGLKKSGFSFKTDGAMTATEFNKICGIIDDETAE
jgi:hypothetical protein